jgi:phage terminase large subunit-like protein
LLHADRIKDTRAKPNTAGAFSFIEVWFGKDLEFAKKNNLFSTIVFKTYDNYEGWTAAAVDGVVLDEVPPPMVYIEAKQRTITTQGYLNLTFTPDKGMNDTTQLFFPDGEYTPGAKSDNKYIVFASVYDAPHLTPEMISKMIEDMPDYLQQAKLHGIPYLGQGAVFPVMKESILADPFPIPNSWERAFGMDTGWVATAALFGARDPNTGTIYIYAEYKEGQQPPDTHARRIKSIRDSSGKFEEMVGCVDCHSQNSHSTGSNDYSIYRGLGLSIFPSDGKAGTVESTILKVYDLLDAGKIKIFKNLTKTIAEYNMYRRGDDGKPVKGNTINNGMHLMDCFRYLITAAMPYASPVPEHDYRNNLVRINLDTFNKVTGY